MANERKLIDADALIKSMREEDLLYPGVPWSTTGVQKQIDKLPTVDAVEVVRCKDCCSWVQGDDDSGLCVVDIPPVDMLDVDGVRRLAYDFCSYGERRDKDAVD